MSTILITGRNGFIGRNLVEALKGKHKIVSAIRRVNRSIDYSREDLIVSDIKDLSIEAIKKYPLDMIVHLAASLRGKGASIERNNIAGSKNIFDLAERLNIPVLFVSSFNSLFSKNLGSYAYSKNACEHLLSHSKLRYLIVRVPLVVGPDLPVVRSVRKFYKKYGFLPLLGKGLGKTQPVPISLFVRFLKERIDQNGFGRNILNVVGREAYAYRDILKNILKEKNVRFLAIPLGLSLSLIRFLELMHVPFSLSSEEIKSVNIDKLFDGQKHGEVVLLDNRKEILF